jgi:hypothetical protein
MTPTFKELQKDLWRAVAYFQKVSLTERIPWMGAFPNNSCEVASALLAAALQGKYPACMVRQVHAYNPEISQLHCWVRLDGITIDPTLQQFEGYESPLLTADAHPLQGLFFVTQELQHIEALGRLALPESFSSELVQRLREKMHCKVSNFD